jgi:hypothetical protein
LQFQSAIKSIAAGDMALDVDHLLQASNYDSNARALVVRSS